MERRPKRILAILSTVALLTIATGITSCSDGGSSKINLAENEQQKEEVFGQIMDNDQVFNEFMNQMMEDTETMHRMMENQQLMNHMFRDENLNYIMEHNEGMDRHMMEGMRNMMNRNPSLNREWDRMMHDDDNTMHE